MKIHVEWEIVEKHAWTFEVPDDFDPAGNSEDHLKLHTMCADAEGDDTWRGTEDRATVSYEVTQQ